MQESALIPQNNVFKISREVICCPDFLLSKGDVVQVVQTDIIWGKLFVRVKVLESSEPSFVDQFTHLDFAEIL